MRSKLFISYSVLAEANVYRLRGEQELSLRALKEALALAREIGVCTPSYCPRDDAAHLYALALEAGIETEYVRDTIVKTRLPPPPGIFPERWPWPVRIYTLGRFTVLKDDLPLTFSGRTQKKPLELLRALIALGGRNVPVTKLAQLFWPHRSRQLAKTALETTLHRLRKLLGEKAIVMQGRELSLNPAHCWLDLWSFERLVDTDATTPALARSKQLLHLYRGPFLADEALPWAAIERERRRSQFLRALSRLGERLEAEGSWQDAIALYHEGLEAEPLAEPLYQSLMRCYRRINRTAEALAVYRRCHTTLQALGMEPTRETKGLFAEASS